MSTRRDGALTTLRRFGLDPDTAGALAGDAVAALLDGPDAAPVADALAELGGEEAARLLAERAAASAGGDRGRQKALRRALFRLAQRGVPVPNLEQPPVTRPALGGPELEGFVSACDGRGTRLIWLLKTAPGGGTLLVAAEVHEPDGLRDVRLTEITRKELRSVRDRLQREAGLRLVPADWRVLDALLMEAHARGGAPDRARDYARLRPQLVSGPPLPAAEPVSPLAAPPAADERDALVAGSDALLGIPEFQRWWPAPEAMAPFIEEIAAVRDSPLVLSPAHQEERLRTILARAASVLYPPAIIARRLEGTAFVLAETGRAQAARQALAVAAALCAGIGADDVPLLRALIQQGLGALYAAEQSKRQDARRGSLVLTPGEALTPTASSRRGRTRA